jgi:hypothetical protein
LCAPVNAILTQGAFGTDETVDLDVAIQFARRDVDSLCAVGEVEGFTVQRIAALDVQHVGRCPFFNHPAQCCSLLHSTVTVMK